MLGEPTAGKPSVRMGDVSEPHPMMGSPAPLMGGVCPPKADMASYTTKMQAKIIKTWQLPVHSDKVIKVLFKINNNGSISNLKIDSPSGDAKLDQKALTAVKRASPFDKLPPGSPANIDSQFVFQNAPTKGQNKL
jgi:TonB family protein